MLRLSSTLSVLKAENPTGDVSDDSYVSYRRAAFSTTLAFVCEAQYYFAIFHQYRLLSWSVSEVNDAFSRQKYLPPLKLKYLCRSVDGAILFRDRVIK